MSNITGRKLLESYNEALEGMVWSGKVGRATAITRCEECQVEVGSTTDRAGRKVNVYIKITAEEEDDDE